MCGRFTLTTPPEEIADCFALDAVPELAPRYNIAPTQEVGTVQAGSSGAREFRRRRWGLVPHWSKDPRMGARLINARSETLVEKPSFREAFRHRRCLVPADGFYEWAGKGRGSRQPHHIRRPDRGPFAIAGLHERWRDEAGAWLETCTLVTVPANARLAPVHHRMPAILPPEQWDAWLDPEVADAVRLLPLLRPCPDSELEFAAVSRRVNRPQFDDPGCLAPATPEEAR
ncbi:MAG: SOS response-associated peptidase [Myxococcota bacterium]|nr:SOS response-associated peptidase [Myxococcota bacterium]